MALPTGTFRLKAATGFFDREMWSLNRDALLINMALYGRSIWNDFTITLRQGNVVLWLIAINLAIFFLQGVVDLIGFLFIVDDSAFLSFYKEYFYAPSNLGSLLYRPWTLLTYAFFHADFWHILFNLLYLYWFTDISSVS